MNRLLAAPGILHRSLRAALYLGLALLLLYPFLSKRFSSQVFVDEVGFMSAGHAGVTRLLQGDLNGPGWNAHDWASYGPHNPMLAKLLIGAAIYASGHGGHEYATWKNKLPSPTETEVRAARWPGALLGWGGCLLLLVIGHRVSVFTGVAASLYAAYNDSYVYGCSLAMLEGPLLFFMVLTLFAVLRLKDRLYGAAATTAALSASIAVGMSAAGAVSAKLSGGAVCLFAAAVPAFLAVSPLLHAAPVPRPRLAAASALTVLIVTALGFYCLNPQFHRKPIAQLSSTVSFWRPFKPGKEPRLSRWESFTTVTYAMTSEKPTSKRLFRPLFEWGARRWPARKNRFEHVYVNRFGSVDSVLMVIAVFSIARARWKRGRLARLSDEEIFLAFAVVVWTGLIAWLPLVQGRYFLPPFITTPLLVAIGLGSVGATLARGVAMIASRRSDREVASAGR